MSKRRVEEILEYYCNKKVVRQHSKDPEKWGYWELVGTEKDDPDVVAKDHESRMEKQLIHNGKSPTKTQVASPTGGTGVTISAPTPVAAPKPKCGTPVPVSP